MATLLPSPIFEHEALLGEVLGLLDEADGASWEDSARRAAGMLKKALQAGRTKSVAYWQRVYQNALAKGKKADVGKGAKAEPANTSSADVYPAGDALPGKDAAYRKFKIAGDEDEIGAAEKVRKFKVAGAEGEIDDTEKVRKFKVAGDEGEIGSSEKVRKFKVAGDDVPTDETTVDDAARGVDVSGLSEEHARLVQNKKNRTRLGEAAAGEVAAKTGSVLNDIGTILGGVAGAIGAIGNWVAGSLSSLDAKTVGKAAGSLVFAALGGLAFGGIGALAGMALAQYFGQRASSSRGSRDEQVIVDVRRAMTLAEKKGTDDASKRWATHVLGAVEEGFKNLGSMDPEELAAILKAAKRFKKDLLPTKDD